MKTRKIKLKIPLKIIYVLAILTLIISSTGCKKEPKIVPVEEIPDEDVIEDIPEYLTTDGILIYKQEEIKESEMLVELDGELLEYNEKYNKGEKGYLKIITFRERSLVPLRELAEKLGYEISWEGAGQKQALTIQGNGIIIVSQLNSNVFHITKDGTTQKVFTETPTIKYDGKIYVPVRFIGETLGLDVNWLDDEFKVELKTK